MLVSQLVLSQEVCFEEGDWVRLATGLAEQGANLAEVEIEACEHSDATLLFCDHIEVELKQVPIKVLVIRCDCEYICAFYDG